MRTPRIKAPTTHRDTFYHCMTRTVNGAFLFDDPAKEVLRKQIYQIADYCGVQVLTYAILSNHFHLLLRIPQAVPVSDAELLRRYSVLYPKPTRHQLLRLETIQSWLATHSPEGTAWRQRQLALMGDLSSYMKLLKQRFSTWFNHTHNRFGTLWAERFKSVLVEPSSHALLTLSAYIDLNPIRAGLVTDPKDYRFCGYSSALHGHPLARKGLTFTLLGHPFSNAQTLPNTPSSPTLSHAPASTAPASLPQPSSAPATAAAPSLPNTAPSAAPAAPPAPTPLPRPHPSWPSLLADYRRTLFGVGAGARPGSASIDPAAASAVDRQRGQIPPHHLLRSRIRHFTDGAVLGSATFVAEHLNAYRQRTGRRRSSSPIPLPALSSCHGPSLTILRRLRSDP